MQRSALTQPKCPPRAAASPSTKTDPCPIHTPYPPYTSGHRHQDHPCRAGAVEVWNTHVENPACSPSPGVRACARNSCHRSRLRRCRSRAGRRSCLCCCMLRCDRWSFWRVGMISFLFHGIVSFLWIWWVSVSCRYLRGCVVESVVRRGVL